MKRKYAPLVPLMLLALSFAPAARSQESPAAAGSPPSPIISAALEKMPLMFIANQGQFDPEVFFVLRGRDKTLFFTAGGVTLVLSEPRPGPGGALQRAALREDRDPPRQWAARLEFAGADPGVVPQGRRRVSTVFSYFRGTPDRWRTAGKAGRCSLSSFIIPLSEEESDTDGA